jgi:hypothetical protein
MKQSIKALVDKGMENKDAEELAKIKSDLGLVKQELKVIEEATKTQVELTTLKKALEVELQNANGKAEKELADMKKAVDAINMENKESKQLKKSLAEEIKKANGKTETELLELKKALDNINLSKIETKSKSEWDAIRKDMECLKTELQEKQVVETSAAEQELLAMKKVVEAINIKELENKNKSEFGAIRKEMDALKAELKYKDDGEEALKKAIEDLKTQARSSVGLPPKKDKAGIKKFLARRFSRKSVTLGKSADSCDSVDDERSIRTAPSPNEVSTILPPSVSKADEHLADTASSSDNSEAREPPAVQSSKSKEESVVTVKAGTKKAAAPPPPLPPSGKQQTVEVKKTKTTGAGFSSFATPGTYPMTRTSSKTHIKDNGEVELEAIVETDFFQSSSPITQASTFT